MQRKSNRKRVTAELECLDNVTYSMFDAEQNKPSTKYGSARLCGNLTDFERHVEYRAQRKHPRPCEACGAGSYNICGLYNVPLHFFPQRVFQTKKTCFIKYHSEVFFGLAQSDSTFLGKLKINGGNQANKLWTGMRDILKGCRPLTWNHK